MKGTPAIGVGHSHQLRRLQISQADEPSQSGGLGIADADLQDVNMCLPGPWIKIIIQ